MSNIKEEKFRKIKKQKVGASITGMFVLAVIIFTAFSLMIAVFALYVIDSKIRDENTRVTDLAGLYMTSEIKQSADVLSTLNKEGNDYIIVDAGKNVVKVHGNDTCDLSDGGQINTLEYVMTVYADKDIRAVRPSINGRVAFDVGMIRDLFVEYGRNGDALYADLSDFIRLPIWIEVPIDNGQSFIGKAYLILYFRELGVIALLTLIIMCLTVALFIYIIVFLVKHLKIRKRTSEVFYMDEITGDHNWLWFLANAEQELLKKSNGSSKYAVLDIVFVNYRNYCVCHSVKEGEEILCKVNEIIKRHLNRKELSAHHSAAHFAALMTYSDRDVLEGRIRDMVADLEKVNDDHKFSFWVGVDRIGVAVDASGKVMRRRKVDIEKEYNNAGAARATITGEDSAIVFFDDKMVEEQKWLDWVNENQAKALENEEFQVYYQPKYDPRTGELCGAEALIRWNSSEHGMVSPGRFIPQFEKNGFITRIDHYMLEHVARDQKAWLDEGRQCVPVSVNVSRAHFIEENLAEQIRDIVDAAGTPHDLVEIELTESAFFDDKNALITTIKKLKEYGFSVSMDDFGSGYSSLNSLKEMPLDVLKLDADFFRNDDGERGRIVVSEAISLAKKLHMRTVAEGVEEKDQVDFLAQEGCDLIQGFYFAKPMPKDEYAGRMSKVM